MKRIVAVVLAAVLLISLLPVTASAASGEKLIAVTFDDGPGAYTSRLLDGLRERGVHCTFFTLGSCAENRPGLIKQMWLDGHEIGCHTYDHPALTGLTNDQIRNQLNKSYNILNKAVGFDLDYVVRPPYGDFNSRVLSTVNRPCFYWSVDTRDWESRNADAVYNMFLNYAKDGSIVLMHDIHSTTVDGALRAIDTLLSKGYKFVTVSELFLRRGITLENGSIYYSAYPGDYGTDDAIQNPVISWEVKNGAAQVTIQGDSRGKVYYTTNGEDPTPENGILYSGPFSINGKVTVKAESVVCWNGVRSGITSEVVRYRPARAPLLTFEDGKLTMESVTPNVKIYYTTDGSLPTEKSLRYTGSIAAVPGTVYRAISLADDYDPSSITTRTYTAHGHVLKDVSVTAWYYEAVDRVLTEGLFKGVADMKFGPDQELTRAMLVTILYRMQDNPEIAQLDSLFNDVPDTMWCKDAIAWAAQSGIVNGYTDGSFRPNQALKRQELCAMLARYLRYIGKDLSSIEYGMLNSFNDAASVPSYFVEDVDTICSLCIITGYSDNTLRPARTTTRAQAATMLCRMLDTLPNIPDVQIEIEEPVDPEGTTGHEEPEAQ